MPKPESLKARMRLQLRAQNIIVNRLSESYKTTWKVTKQPPAEEEETTKVICSLKSFWVAQVFAWVFPSFLPSLRVFMTSWIWTLPDRQGSPEPWSSVGAKCNFWRHSTFSVDGGLVPPSCSFFPILHSSIQQPSKLVLLCTRLNTRVGNSNTDQFLQRLRTF